MKLDFYFLCLLLSVSDNFGNKVIIVDVMTIHLLRCSVASLRFLMNESQNLFSLSKMTLFSLSFFTKGLISFADNCIFFSISNFFE